MLFQTKNSAPDVYTEESRDFLLFESILDCLFNTLINNKNKLDYLDDIENVDSKLLDLIAEYLGFFTNLYYPENLMRSILINFPLMIKNKGNMIGLLTAILALMAAYTNITYISIDRVGDSNVDVKNLFYIKTDGVIVDNKYINDVLKYVLPIGTIIDLIYIIRDINNLPSDYIKLADKSDKVVYIKYTKDADGNNYVSYIRRSSDTPFTSPNELYNRYISAINSTPIVRASLRTTISILLQQ